MKQKIWAKWQTMPWYIRYLVYLGTMVMVLCIFCIKSYRVPSDAMAPTLAEGDRFLSMNRWLLPFWPIQRGDVIIFISVEDQKTRLAQRVVGLPNERLAIKPPSIWINGKLLAQPPIFLKNEYLSYGTYGSKSPFSIPEDSYFVMGDHSDQSNDSRFWGHLPAKHVTGKAVFIWWPPKRIGLIQ